MCIRDRDSSQNVSLDVSVTTIFSAEGWSAKEQAEKGAREQGAEASAEEIRQAVSEVTSENYAVPTTERLSAGGSADVTGVKAEPEDEKMSDAFTTLSIRPEPSESPVELPTAPDQQTMETATVTPSGPASSSDIRQRSPGGNSRPNVTAVDLASESDDSRMT